MRNVVLPFPLYHGGRNLAFSEYFKAISIKIIPSTRHMFAMFEPRTFPMDTPTFSGSIIANMATNSSGKDVENATRMNPIAVFPKPVALATFTECLIVKRLA